jgi:NADP-dependent 3-hydroxy acid dehydrogenase YdfG
VNSPLRNQVAAITGASSGIGAACARAFAAEGMGVVLAARRADRLTQVCSEVEAAGGRALAVVADVTRDADMRDLVGRALEAFGRLDVMVCNAGIGYHGRLEETDPEVMARVMDVNFMGTFRAVRAALPLFARQRHGHLLIVSSIVGRRGAPFYAAYSASKFAQAGFGEALRAELVGTGVQVAVVFPVTTTTEFRETMRRSFGFTTTGRGPEQPAEAVAAAMVRCLKHPRPEVWPYRPARLLGVLNMLVPRATDRLVVRFARRRLSEDVRHGVPS